MNNRKKNIIYALIGTIPIVFMVFPSDDPRVIGVRWPFVLIMPIAFYASLCIFDWIINLFIRVAEKMDSSLQQHKQATLKSARKKRAERTKNKNDD